MKSYLLNLASRPDRLESSMNELAKIGIVPERFESFTGPNRPLAFNKSQYYCIKKAVEEEQPVFAIFEDDVAFTEGAADLIKKALSELPESFALLHLGTNIIGMSTTEWDMPIPYSDHLAILQNSWQTHCVIWNYHAAVSFLKNFPFYTDDYMTEGLMIYDEWLRQKFYPNWECFVMKPMVCYQKPDTSDIWGGHGDYTYAFEQGNKWLKENL